MAGAITAAPTSDAYISTSYEDYLKEKAKGQPIKQEMDKDMFFNLLVTQLQNQDPMNPMEDRDFIAQMATFTSLEKMTQLAETMNLTFANSLIGKSVLATIKDSIGNERVIAGRVDSTFVRNGTVYLMVGNDIVEADKVMQYFDDGDTFNNLVVNSSSLIGKYVEAEINGEPVEGSTEEPPKQTIRARVDEVVVENGKALLICEGKRVEMYQIKRVTETMPTATETPQS